MNEPGQERADDFGSGDSETVDVSGDRQVVDVSGDRQAVDVSGDRQAVDQRDKVQENAINAGEELRKRRSSRIVQAVPLTVTGVGTGVTGCWSRGGLEAMTAALPSSPQVLSPQQRILPSWRSAQVCQPPAATATAVVMPLTLAGVGLGALTVGDTVPLPS